MCVGFDTTAYHAFRATECLGEDKCTSVSLPLSLQAPNAGCGESHRGESGKIISKCSHSSPGPRFPIAPSGAGLLSAEVSRCSSSNNGRTGVHGWRCILGRIFNSLCLFCLRAPLFLSFHCKKKAPLSPCCEEQREAIAIVVCPCGPPKN